MRPSNRTIYKVLMKGRKGAFWGPRAFVTVRLPVSVLPAPVPSVDYCKGWGWSTTEVGGWLKDLGDGVTEIRYIHRVHSSTDPTLRGPPTPAIHHLTAERRGEQVTYYWWEGILAVIRTVDGTETQERFELPAEAITAHRAVYEYSAKYLSGAMDDTVLQDPTLRAFLTVADYAKLHDVALHGQFLYLTYAVKWFLPGATRLFSRELSRAFRVAGHNVKLMRSRS
jgi:hypothetical protein